jgi:copper chaperone
MKTYRFKTSAKCKGCVDTIATYLNQVPGIGHWKIDLLSSEKILEVESDVDLSSLIIDAVIKAGYRIEPMMS